MAAISRQNKREKGQSLIELAVGMVVLLTLLAGIVDLGRLLFFYIALRDAAQEGAVVGQLNPRDCNAIKARVDDYLGVTSGAGYNVAVNVAHRTCVYSSTVPENSCAGNDIDITVSAPFSFMMPFMGGQQITLEATINGTVLRPACP